MALKTSSEVAFIQRSKGILFIRSWVNLLALHLVQREREHPVTGKATSQKHENDRGE